MKVLELSVRTDAEGAEALAALLNEQAYGGAVIEETVTPEPNEPRDDARPFTVRAFLLMDDTVEAKRRALEEAIWHYAQLRPISEPHVRELVEEDWANAWKQYYTVQHLGRRTVIKPSWLDYTPQEGEVVVELDPGMAFGTGLHPTTRLCVRALEDYLVPGSEVLDVGTGSGILAIAAVRLGAWRVLALDIDPVAVETARENVARNGVEGRVHVERGTAQPNREAASPRYGLVLANILAEVIIELAPALAANVADEGRVVASGILLEKQARVREALEAQGLAVTEVRQDEDWVAMVARPHHG